MQLNRTAKLKQYKLDARREQWLSQGKICSRSDQDQHYEGWKDHEQKEGEVSSSISEQDISPKSEGSTSKTFKISSEEFTGSVTEESDNESSIVNPYEDQVDSNVSVLPKDGNSSGIIVLKDGDPMKENKSKSEIESRPISFHYSSVASRSQKDKNLVLTREGCPKQNTVNDSLTGQKGKFKNAMEKRKTCDIRNMMKSYGVTDDNLSQMKQKQDQVKDWLSSDLSACLSNDGPTSNSAISTGNKGTEGPLEEEDWEAAADALCAQTLLDCKEISAAESVIRKAQQYEPLEGERESKGARNSDLHNGLLKPDYKTKLNPFFNRSRSMGCCAWRPDDVSRPPTLPTLRKQQSTPRETSSTLWGPVFTKSGWLAPVSPAECPICAEELDSTDSSFVPCACGFRPCLFCVHRIASEDGRCPGCRREYSFDVSLKSAHSSSVRLKA
ncbi:hypothetical protein O6H91_23G013600 [Diphasiastrum complanatum]|uniref:Uncharacterized protein n=1 Tax=Diphasiastrum complanatum TaxID=34168 RepID=A0ACC2A894_DIPCM|nr:hypothetical protein O6H91_23G013600 [Diphasiastrum complanatum]